MTPFPTNGASPHFENQEVSEMLPSSHIFCSLGLCEPALPVTCESTFQLILSFLTRHRVTFKQDLLVKS